MLHLNLIYFCVDYASALFLTALKCSKCNVYADCVSAVFAQSANDLILLSAGSYVELSASITLKEKEKI